MNIAVHNKYPTVNSWILRKGLDTVVTKPDSSRGDLNAPPLRVGAFRSQLEESGFVTLASKTLPQDSTRCRLDIN